MIRVSVALGGRFLCTSCSAMSHVRIGGQLRRVRYAATRNRPHSSRSAGSSRRSSPRCSICRRGRGRARARWLASVWSALVALAAIAPLPSATAGSARVALRPGDLAVSNTSVTIARQDPLELDLRVDVVDARGSGEGWSVSLGGYSASSPSSSSFVITGADVACSRGSSCTLPVNNVAYPSVVRLTGARTKVFGS
jgi:hypothetical protein